MSLIYRQRLTYLRATMGQLTNKEIKLTDEVPIINATDVSNKIETLTVPAIALKGKDDYAKNPPKLKMTLAEGGHVSPLAARQEVLNFIHEVIRLSNIEKSISL